ncbi:ABC transporter substrate-binding protein [Devosia sp. MC532]|uniref:ABC transporter substrate-binding protein n=1 Tax=unclassified Devosia TaxID=196773 RepID=UPI0018F51301|nr:MULTISPECIES: ABC transporter substrate-binding protein [unclassified Devosia]MBJ7579324.1 ABC transporter substrate-binding protein [Devosia sp. MC532]MBK1796174.1 ABC transporter substrate-binding protein [Devosia sp. WQ 349K1]
MISRVSILTAVSVCACTSALAAPFDGDGCLTSYSAGEDYFAHKAKITNAKNFSLSYHDSYKLLTVKKPFPGGQPETYLLNLCGAPLPKLEQQIDAVIQVPIRSVFAGSTTQNPSLLALGQVETITGIARKDFVSLPEVLAQISKPDVTEFESSGAVDVERIASAQPDLVLAAGSGSAEMAQVRNLGISVVNHSDWQETTPLGRAEWIKFVAALYNEEAKANAVYDEITAGYATAVASVAHLTDEQKPWVLSGSAFEGTFFAAGGASFVAASIVDAGGRYVFETDTNAGSFQIHDFERLIVSALDAQFWIHASNDYLSLADIAADDPRLAALPAAQAGQVWMPDALKGPNGGVQIYEMGTLRPDLVIKDLISILHPDLAGDHERVFYRSITNDTKTTGGNT